MVSVLGFAYGFRRRKECFLIWFPSLVFLWFPSSRETFVYGFRPWFSYGFRAATAPPVIVDGNYTKTAWTFPRTTKYIYIYIYICLSIYMCIYIYI